jgi:hypothetical protein
VYTFTLTDEMLSETERDRFAVYLEEQGLDDAVWDVYACFLDTENRMTKPRVLRAFRDNELVAVAFLARCRAWAGSVFKPKALAAAFDLVGIPAYMWIRVGYGAEVLANPGFFATDAPREEIAATMLRYLHRKSYGLIVIDHEDQAHLHTRVKGYPYVCDGSVHINGMVKVQDYVAEHGSIKRKIKAFENKGGTIDRVHGAIDDALFENIRHCLESTVERSVIYSPWQDNAAAMAVRTCRAESDRFVHFIARMNGDLLGYHSFVQTGNGLRMLHGAFDRTRRTTHHSYENLIIHTVGYAIDNGLESVHFGPVLNVTKQRMMNRFGKTRLYFYSNNPVIRFFFRLIFPYSRMQSGKLLAFKDGGVPHHPRKRIAD